MQIALTQERRDFIRRAMDEGRLKSEEEAVSRALDLWLEHGRRRDDALAAIDEGEASLAESQGLSEASMRELADDVKRRGRTRIAEGRKAVRVDWR